MHCHARLTRAASALHSIQRRPAICGDTGSDGAVRKVSAFLQNCGRKHRSCNQALLAKTESKPARLIEIELTTISGSDGYSIKLTDNFSSTTRYACLSHCWGSEKFVCTNTSVLSDFSRAIPWSLLPKTFQDAVSFSCRLGLRHIWIDSLCICQDDALDWRHEGSKMDSIYAGAYVTLAALSASSAKDGCYKTSTARCSTRNIQNWWSKQKLHEVCIREKFDHVKYDSDIMPLTQRAWAFQERLLSTRIVYFAPDELLWECMERSGCECWTLKSRKPVANSTRLWIRSDNTLFSEDWVMYHSELWHEIVTEYTRRQLTYEKDIFPALQGIARRLSTRTSSAYRAGLWEVTLPMDFLWITRTPGTYARPKQWRAPTWSWASVVGSVYWEPSTMRPTASVISCTTIPAGDDELGEINGGKLRLKGRCIRPSLLRLSQEYSDKMGCTDITYSLTLKSDHASDATPPICYVDYNIQTSQRHQWKPRLDHDCLDEEAQTGPPSKDTVPGYDHILLMQIASCGFYPTKSFFLALICVNTAPREYERFGIAMSAWTGSTYQDYDRWLERGEREITIV
jgi:hypothetical protein